MAKQPRKAGTRQKGARLRQVLSVADETAGALSTPVPEADDAEMPETEARFAVLEAAGEPGFGDADESIEPEEGAAGDRLQAAVEEAGPPESRFEAVDPAAELGATAGPAAEDDVERAGEVFRRAEELALKGSNPLALSCSAALKGIVEINARAVDAWRVNTISTLRFVEALMGTRSFAEAIELQTQHARRQFETVTSQAKDLAELARRVASATAEPLQSRSKSVGTGRAA